MDRLLDDIALNHEELPIQARYFYMIYDEFYSYTLCKHWLHQSMLAEESHISSDPVEKRDIMLFHVIPLQHVKFWPVTELTTFRMEWWHRCF